MQMPDPRDRIIRALVYLVLALFLAGVGAAGWVTYGFTGPPRPDALPEVATKFLVAINGLLSVNLGVYLGVRSTVTGWETVPAGYLQKVACWVYVWAFAAALVFWAMVGFSSDATRVAPILPAVVLAGLGVVVAVFGAQLGVTQALLGIRFVATSVPKS
jgi:hypothetical protein